MENDIYALIADLEVQIENGKKVPFTTNQYVIDREAAMMLLQTIRDALPEALKEANHVIRQETRILQDARRHSDNIIAESDAKARMLRMESEQRAESVANTARQQADETVQKAEQKAQSIVESAERRAEELVSQTSITVRAEQQANDLLTTARGEAQRTRMAVYDHCADLLKSVEDSVIGVANELRDSRLQLDNER